MHLDSPLSSITLLCGNVSVFVMELHLQFRAVWCRVVVVVLLCDDASHALA